MKKANHFPSLEAFREKAGPGRIVPVYRDILADADTPVSAFMKIDTGGTAFLLESVEGGEKWGRYSILGTGGMLTVRSKGNVTEVIEGGRSTQQRDADPIETVKELMARYSAVGVEGAPRFSGGAIGYLGYDIIRHIERLPDTAPREIDLYDMYFVLTDTFLVFDNVEHKIKVICNAYIADDADAGEVYGKSVAKIDAIVDVLRKKAVPQKPAPTPAADRSVRSNFTRDGFMRAVERAKRYIENGDVIQAVLSQRFSTHLDCDPFDIYRALRVINPSPYMFFLRFEDTTLVGSSPELLVRVEGETVNVKPIAGTRKRGRDEEEDGELEKELLADPKEIAEHIMLVDLGRNDLGRVCKAGTVEVDGLMSIERYSHVMHIVSDVKGALDEGQDAFTAFRACFPAGTLTGAPKIRAMEIIEELEPCKRGIYGGSVGYFSYGSNMDMCIAIRTMVIKGGTCYVQAGAGIVADSVPEKEFEETQNKAMAVLKAIDMAREGLY